MASLSEIRSTVAELFPDEHPDSDLSRSGVLLLASLEVSPSMPKLRGFTALPVDLINRTRFYLRACGVWAGNHSANYRVELNPNGFRSDCLVATGRLVRRSWVVWDRVIGEPGPPIYSYRLRTLADYSSIELEGADQIAWADLNRPELRESKRLERAERAVANRRQLSRLDSLRERQEQADLDGSHQHDWQPTRISRTLGGQLFTIDHCTADNHGHPCLIERAHRVSPPSPQPRRVHTRTPPTQP